MTQTVTYRADVIPRKDESLIFGTETYFWGPSSSSAVTVPFRGSYAYEHKVSSVEETDVVTSLLSQVAARAFEAALYQILQRSREWVSKLQAATAPDQVEMDLGVEREIVLRMPPYASRKIKVRAKYVGPAKPKVVYDPLPEDEERSQE